MQQWQSEPVLRGSSQRSAEDEFRYQTLTLQVVRPYLSLRRIQTCQTDQPQVSLSQNLQCRLAKGVDSGFEGCCVTSCKRSTLQ